jgi:GxxExxY protein
MADELAKRGSAAKAEQPVQVVDGERNVDARFELGLHVNDLLIVELTAVVDLHPLFRAQLLTHRKLRQLRLGVLNNRP